MHELIRAFMAIHKNYTENKVLGFINKYHKIQIFGEICQCRIKS